MLLEWRSPTAQGLRCQAKEPGLVMEENGGLSLPPIFLILLFMAASMAYGGPQARGQIGATAASLPHSHGNTRFELHLQPTPQLMATPGP